ncbi:MAG: hypothetical protein JO116_04400 [Planctomycetaceae bacterium]|nr:hypothetical protein [Planctomycetaceae bacterium]
MRGTRRLQPSVLGVGPLDLPQRSICHNNEERATLKRRISELFGAARHEEEQDPPYGVWNEASA